MIKIDAVQVGPRRRPSRDVSALADSIAEVGLLQPIVVTPSARLVAGYHRLEACKALGWTEIPATVVDLDELGAELAEIDENLIRNDLTELERGRHCIRRQEIHEVLHPDTKAGAAQAAGMNRKLGHNVAVDSTATFAKDAAAKLGVSESTVRQSIQIARDIVPEVQEAIRDTPLADRKDDLLKLSRMDEDEQRDVATAVADKGAASLRDARGGGGMFSSRSVEHYTPEGIVDSVVDCLGAIDLDPCSHDAERSHIPAAKHFVLADDGLTQDWWGRVYMNPPYGREIGTWVAKLVESYEAGAVSAAIALVPARTDTKWWSLIDDHLLCLLRGRLHFTKDAAQGGAPFPSAAFYLGHDWRAFVESFGPLGSVWERVPGV